MMKESDVQKILDKTSDGLNVFTHYLGEVKPNMAFSNPYRDDEHPSCRLIYRQGKWYLKDYGSSSWCGDCFNFVALVRNLDLKSCFKEILHIIDRDLNLFILDDDPSLNITLTEVKKATVHPHYYSCSKIVAFEPTFQPFTASELSFWGRYGITSEMLEHHDVRSIKSCLFTREDGTTYTEHSSNGYPLFAYVNTMTLLSADGQQQEQLKGMKVYRPKSKKGRFMYVGQLRKPYMYGDLLWTDDTFPKEDVIYITGGEKDVLSLIAHGFHALCLNSETASVSSTLIEQLLGKFRWVVFLYDSDPCGKKESLARVEEFGDRYAVTRLVLPLRGTKSEKDISDFFALGHTSDELISLTRECLK